MTDINLFYLTPNKTGGWVTYLAHLVAAFEAVGVTGKIIKVGNNTERTMRPFGYDLKYQNMCVDDAIQEATRRPSLIVAAAKKFKDITDELMAEGASLVVHDPTELKNLPKDIDIMQSQCVVIRKAGLKMLPDATFIRHPYKRQMPSGAVKDRLCISTSRIDFDKRTEILLDANRQLPTGDKIHIRGFENRLYTKFKILPKYPEWVQSIAAYPREFDAAFKLLEHYRYMADMSAIKGDGGGTQYTTLEAWDAGAVPLIHADWMLPDDEMRDTFNCITVHDDIELADRLKRPNVPLEEAVREEGYRALSAHHPRLIGQDYKEFLNV